MVGDSCGGVVAEVAKRLTETILDQGVISLTEDQRTELELPAHSVEIELRHGSEASTLR